MGSTGLSDHVFRRWFAVPMVLKCCAEFIEEYGVVDGIYRLSGVTSNIQKLRYRRFTGFLLGFLRVFEVFAEKILKIKLAGELSFT